MQWCGFVAGPLLTLVIPSLSRERGVRRLFVWCQTEANLFITRRPVAASASRLSDHFRPLAWGMGTRCSHLLL